MEFLNKLNEILGKIDPDKAQPIIDALKKPEFAALVQRLGLPDPEIAVDVLSFLLPLVPEVRTAISDILKVISAK